MEKKIKTGLKIINFGIQTNIPNKHINSVTKDIIKSLEDDKAKVANRLSLSRIPLGLAIPLTAYFTKNDKLLLGEITFYTISDFLDGLYAKHVIKHPTKGGTYIDAICDKIGAAELLLSAINKNPALITNTILESIISLINIKNTKEGIKVKSTKLGKFKMWPLSLALICTYMSNTGLKTKNFKIEKDTFKAITGILIPITAALETANIIQYKSLSKTKKNRN